MSNEYGFFASKDHDRRYSADDFSAFFGDFFTNGVLGSDASALMVSAAGDMDISIAAGTAYINGHWYRKQSAQVLTLGDSDEVSKRIDAVVIRCDLEKRMVYPYIIEGVPDETAAEPAPVRNERFYDIVLAYIAVAANCVEITAADIADKRGFDDVCGFVTSAIDHIDTKALFAQYEARWKLLEAGCAQDAEAVIAAWSQLGNVKTVNGVEPIDGNVALDQSLIPSGGGAYQMPYYIQCGTATTIAYNTLKITFPKAFKSAPIVCLSPKTLNNSSDVTAVAHTNISNTDFSVKGVYFNSYSSDAAVTFTWIAFGELA